MNNDILIAFFSWQGNTKTIAEMIQQKTGGQLFEIEPVTPYPTDYSAVLAQAKEEIGQGFKPELKAMPQDTAASRIIIGSPNWCSTIAPPLAAFIDRYDLTDKTVAPFYTHGGGGCGRIESDIKNLCPNSTVAKAFGVCNSGDGNTPRLLDDWLSSAGLIS